MSNKTKFVLFTKRKEKKEKKINYFEDDKSRTLRLRGMGSSNSRLLPSWSSRLGSSGPAGPGPTPPMLGTLKGLKLSAESGGDGVEGLDWSLGADQLQ